jgi:hypothetical protein
LINNWYLELSRNGKELFQIDTFFQTEIAIERKKGENEVTFFPLCSQQRSQ